MVNALKLLHDEITLELDKVGTKKFPEVERLAIGKFDSTVHQKTATFLSTLKLYYNIRMNRASERKDSLISSMTATPAGRALFDRDKEKYVNQAVSESVKNNAAADRIVDYDGQLVQKIYPIYMDEHRPSHPLDFSANLYQPTKRLLGLDFDTLTFNIGMIWFMTFGLFVALYFDALKRLIKILEGNRRYRRRDRQ
jgi:hypothetical protein